MVRIPVYKPGKQLSTRIELRSPDPMANPYLVNAVTLAAGLDGIERKLELPPEATAETLKLNDRQMLEAGYTPLPRSLKEALDVFEDSQFMKDALGDHIHGFFLKRSVTSGISSNPRSPNGRSSTTWRTPNRAGLSQYD